MSEGPKPIRPKDRVRLLKASRSFQCAYVGQLGTVVSLTETTVVVAFDCGHRYEAPVSAFARTALYRCMWCRKPYHWRLMKRYPHIQTLRLVCEACWRTVPKGRPQLVMSGKVTTVPKPPPLSTTRRRRRRRKRG